MVAKKRSRPPRRTAGGTLPRAKRARGARPKKDLSPLGIARSKFIANFTYLATKGHKLEPAARSPPFVVIGTADVGQLHYCDAKATFAQKDMETAFASRMFGIIASSARPPIFVKPSPEILGLEVLRPRAADAAKRRIGANSLDYEVAEAEIAKGTWHVGYAAAFVGTALGLPAEATVYLAGILDGAREDGTVLEVRRTGWEFSGIIGQKVNLEKEAQANVYAVLLGMPRWECAFRCRDGEFKTQGTADRERAIADIGRAARLRWGTEQRLGVSLRTTWKCQSARNQCDFLTRCDLTPIPVGERRPSEPV